MRGASWPELAVDEWEDTLTTFHLWTQIVGKIRMALVPKVNHWWHVTLYVSARGLTTSLMPAGNIGVEAEFDLIDHVLEVRTTEGERRRVALEPRTVADFYRATLDAFATVGVPVHIYPQPQEMATVTPFPDDETHRSYDADAVHRYWLALVQANRVLHAFRGGFIGKASPVHYFWGGPDLAVTRFSGRRAPRHPGGVPNCPDWVQVEAYSHEVSSCGYWAGGSAEGSFYAYAYPTPSGFADWRVEPDGAYFDGSLGEFLLPYRRVRAADDPDAYLMSFLQTTYEAAAELAKWDRTELEAESAT